MLDDWEEIELSQVLRLSNKKLGPHAVEPIVFAISKYAGVIPSSDFFGKRIASSNLAGYKIVNPGDWVYSTIHIDEGSIAVNLHPYLGVVSPMYTTMAWNSVEHSPEYFELLLRSPSAIKTYGENAQGSINRRRSLSFDRFSKIRFSVPPLQAQNRIVHLISSVDSYLEKLNIELEASKKCRNAVIGDLLMAVGEGWMDYKFRDIATLTKGKLPQDKNQVGRGVPYLTASYLRTKNADYWIENLDGVVTAEDGDCLILWDGAGAGDLFTARRGVVSSTMALVNPVSSEILRDFLTLLISTKSAYIKETCRGTTVPHVSPDAVINMTMGVPPLSEQSRIIEVSRSLELLETDLQNVIKATVNLRDGLVADLLSGAHEIPSTYETLLGGA